MDSPTAIQVPVEWVESICRIGIPSCIEWRMRELMDGNNEGELSTGEFAELESLVEHSENLTLIKAEAMLLLRKNR